MCRVLDQPRSTQRYQSHRLDDELRLLREMRALARQRPRFGADRIHRLLVERDGQVNHKCVHRLWKRENKQVPGNSILDDVFHAVARIAACVVEQTTKTTSGRTTFDRSEPGWTSVAGISRERRVYSRIPGDRSGSFVHSSGRDGCSTVPLCLPSHAPADPQRQRFGFRGKDGSPLAKTI